MPTDLPYFHVLAKPAGAACNLDCTYCFFLAKQALYPGSRLRMDEPTLSTYIRQYIEAQTGDSVTLAWQGGEPTLMGLDFFRAAVGIARHYARPGVTVEHTIQTNGILLDAEWCEFLHENDFLVGLSIDGPRPLHDAYRVDKGGAPTWRKVIEAAHLLRTHRVDFNILTCVHAVNAAHPLEVYRFLRDEVGSEWVQFIPVVERINGDGRTLYQEGSTVSERSVAPRQWGDFLCAIFDEWVRHDVGRMYINIFEASLAAWLGAPPPLCIFAETCGLALALEHNGDLYSCDHFVEPKHLLGNIVQQPLVDLVNSPQQRAFGEAKRDSLPAQCRACPVQFACRGECPKNRFVQTAAGEAGLNYLCAGYLAFFTHIDRAMRVMAQLHRMGRAPAEVMSIMQMEDIRWKNSANDLGRNAACPCGSGRKVKHCHGQ